VDGDPGDGADKVSVPLEALPDPTLRYEVRDDEPVVTHVNRAFTAAFGQPDTENPLKACLGDSHVGLDDRTVSSVCSSLVESGAVDTRARSQGAKAVRIRSATHPASTDEDGGLVMLTTVDSESDDSIHVENIATVVSHDLRNPLDVAKAHLRAARERGDTEHFDRVDEAHDRMERIIEDVLTLARGDGSVSQSEAVDIGAVARDAWSTVDTGDASLDVASGLPTVDADRSRLQRVFENLFRNAVEHGSTGARSQAREDSVEHGSSSSRSQSAERTDQDAQEAAISVRVGSTGDGGFFVADDGVGIPQEDHDRVFDPGYSSSDTGAGLGLTIVERIVEAHGWTVSIPATATEGARFEFDTRGGA